MAKLQNFLSVCFLVIILYFDFTISWLHNRNSNANALMTRKRTDLKRNCPNVKAIRNFNLESMMGFWYVVQYYASTEESSEYACMRSQFIFSAEDQHVTMNFSYIYAEDPLREKLQGNITWLIPDFSQPAHWMHTEDIYEGIYNTYVIDTDYQSWGLIMHCAEKKKHPRYLSALMISREPILGENVISFLKEKLPRYDIDLSFMFKINQTTCDNLVESAQDDPLAYYINDKKVKESFKLMLKS